MKNKTVLVIGSASGIGRAAADKFLSSGYTVIGIDIASQCSISDFFAVSADIRDYEALDAISNELFNGILNGKELDLMVFTAGVHTMASLAESDIREIRRLMDINLMGAGNCVRAFHKHLKKNGRIIIVTSEVAAYTPMPFNGLYNISKTALEAYADALRQELNLLGQRVITVRPGSTDTPLARNTDAATKALVLSTKLYKNESMHFCKLVNDFKGKPIAPEKIANTVYKASTKKRPKLSYVKHRSLGLVLLNMLPKRLQLFIIKLLIKRKKKQR